jgi:hypothetical protein
MLPGKYITLISWWTKPCIRWTSKKPSLHLILVVILMYMFQRKIGVSWITMRERRQPERYSPPNFHANFSLYIIDDDPRTVNEAVNLDDSKLWKKTIAKEMDALDKNEAWDLVELPTGRNGIGIKWVFNKKLNAKGKVDKY